MSTYTTRDGDMLDQIAHQFYGSSLGAVEAILLENRELAFQPPILPSGIVIDLPVLEEIEDPLKVSLWD